MEAETATVTDDVLFAGLASTVVLLTVAVLVIGAEVAGVVPTIVIIAVPPGRRVPMLHVIVVVPEQLPWLGVADVNVTPAGSVSRTVTPRADAAPEFESASVYVIGALVA
jgi:hypothetical protein